MMSFEGSQGQLMWSLICIHRHSDLFFLVSMGDHWRLLNKGAIPV